MLSLFWGFRLTIWNVNLNEILNLMDGSAKVLD